MKGVLCIELDGVQYPVKITMGALDRFAEMTGVEPSDINGFSLQSRFLYCCAKSGSAFTEHPLEMSYEEFRDKVPMDVFLEWAAVMNAPEDDSKKKKTPVREKP